MYNTYILYIYGICMAHKHANMLVGYYRWTRRVSVGFHTARLRPLFASRAWADKCEKYAMLSVAHVQQQTETCPRRQFVVLWECMVYGIHIYHWGVKNIHMKHTRHSNTTRNHTGYSHVLLCFISVAEMRCYRCVFVGTVYSIWDGRNVAKAMRIKYSSILNVF